MGTRDSPVSVSTLVKANLATLGVLAVGSATVWLFLPYAGTLCWAQICALALRSLRDKCRRASESEAVAARRLLGYTVGGFALLATVATVGLVVDVASVGRGLARAGQAAADGSTAAKGWLAQQAQVAFNDAKPSIVEAGVPFVDGLDSLGGGETVKLRLKVEPIIEKAQLNGTDFEALARRALEAANSFLDGSSSSVSAELKEEAMKAVEFVKAKFQANDAAKEGAKGAAIELLKFLAQSLGLLAGFVAKVMAFCAASASAIVSAVLFLLTVFANLARPDDDLDTLLSTFAMKRDVMKSLAKVLESLVVAPVLRASCFALCTFTLVLFSRAGCATSAALLAFASGLFSPFVPAFIASAPWALALLVKGLPVRAVVLLATHAYVTSKIATAFTASLAQSLLLPASVVNLAYVLGAQRLGLPSGLVLGPLLLAVCTLLCRDAASSNSSSEKTIDLQRIEEEEEEDTAPALLDDDDKAPATTGTTVTLEESKSNGAPPEQRQQQQPPKPPQVPEPPAAVVETIIAPKQKKAAVPPKSKSDGGAAPTTTTKAPSSSQSSAAATPKKAAPVPEKKSRSFISFKSSSKKKAATK